MTTAHPDTWQTRYDKQEQARRRLTERYGSDQEKRWMADPNAPSVDPVSLLYAFLSKADLVGVATPEMEQTPALEREDALAAAHIINVARRDASQREIAAMRQIRARGLSWHELADALDTTADELVDSLRRDGQVPDTWA